MRVHNSPMWLLTLYGSGSAFDPASYFANGELGVVYRMEEAYSDTLGTNKVVSGERLARLNDLSGNNLNAVQSTFNDRPTVVTGPSGQLKAVTDGVNEIIETDFRALASLPVTMVLSVEIEEEFTDYSVSITGGDERLHISLNDNNQFEFWQNSGPAPYFPTGRYVGDVVSITVVWDVASGSKARINGGPWISLNNSTGSVGTRGWRIGANATKSSYRRGAFKDLLIIDRELSEAEISKIEREFVRPGPEFFVNSIFKPQPKDAVAVASTVSGVAPVGHSSFYPSVVDVQNEPEFDGVTHSVTGERLNYLLYTSTDHADPNNAGIHLALCFGDPLTGTWKAYEDARIDGDLSGYAGSTPPALDAGSKIFDAGKQTETPWVKKVANGDWVLLYHRSVSGVGGTEQCTFRTSSSSPFGGFVETTTSFPNNEFLWVDPNNLPPEANGIAPFHTGYPRVLENPPESTQNAPYIVKSLYTGSTSTPSGANAAWSLDENWLNPTLLSVDEIFTSSNAIVPSYGFNVNEQLADLYSRSSSIMHWDGSRFRGLGAGGDLAGSDAARSLVLYETNYADDFITQRTDAVPVLHGAAFNHLGIRLTRLQLPQIIKRPNGQDALLIGGKDDTLSAALGNDFGVTVVVMPFSIDTSPRAPSQEVAPSISGGTSPDSTLVVTPGVYIGYPNVEKTYTVLLNDADVSSNMNGLEYTIPTNANEGDTLSIQERASNGTNPDIVTTLIDTTVTAVALDPDAQDLITRQESVSGLSVEPAVRTAYDTFFKGLKDDGTFNAIKAAAIMVGAPDFASALLPMTSGMPTPSNIGGNFTAADYDRRAGLKGNGSNKSLDTNYATDAAPRNNFHISAYITEVHTDAGAVMGSEGGANRNSLYREGFTGNRSSGYDGTEVLPRSNMEGYYGSSRSNSSNYIIRKNSTQETVNSASVAPPALTLHVFNRNGTSDASDWRLGFYSAGESLDLSAVEARLDTLIADIQAALP